MNPEGYAGMRWDEDRIRAYATRGFMPGTANSNYPGGSLCALQRTIAEVDMLRAKNAALKESFQAAEAKLTERTGLADRSQHRANEFQAKMQQSDKALAAIRAAITPERLREMLREMAGWMDPLRPNIAVAPVRIAMAGELRALAELLEGK